MPEINKIIRFKNDTSVSVLEEVAQKIKEAGGTITGKTTITGKVLMYKIDSDTITTFVTDHSEHIEEVEDDKTVTIQK
ncbi:hypothetical protein Glove_74g23 [Diversispora epigaea]|uniref:Inhibitor I9 domain-containing protein n=1 Tax=Diversispora epigaea TaxID=1348612 RepID=A0A397JI18_9GLOM|nr:hypothetical protein Glove_74g23 [Diversispora epigaea]